LSPSCSYLGVFACDVTTPNEVDVTLVFGRDELNAVERVERLDARLELHPVTPAEVLEERQIQVADAVGPQQRGGCGSTSAPWG
jgi:hypothetical protein